MPKAQLFITCLDDQFYTSTVFLKLLARSATGQKLSTYTQFITGTRREEGEFGPKEFHLVLLDNGRSKILKDPVGRDVLKCIRCGACADVCPVKILIPTILRHLLRRVAESICGRDESQCKAGDRMEDK